MFKCVFYSSTLNRISCLHFKNISIFHSHYHFLTFLQVLNRPDPGQSSNLKFEEVQTSNLTVEEAKTISPEERVNMKFLEADNLGMEVKEVEGVKLEEIVSHVKTSNPVILLVNSNLLKCSCSILIHSQR